MKSMLKLIAAAVIGAAALTACGGHYKAPEAVVVAQPEYKQTDTLVGTGTEAKAGKVNTVYDPADASLPVADRTILISYVTDSQLVTINFTGYLYDSTKADGKGALFETSAPGESVNPVQPFTVGVGRPIANSTNLIGLDQALLGVKLADGTQVPMKVGGKRTVVLPASLAYGANSLAARTVGSKSFAALTPNSPMVYDIELVAVTDLPNIIPATPPTVVTDLVPPVVGTGAVAVAGKYANVLYTGYFYDGTRANRIGTQFDTNVPVTAPVPPATAPTLSFLLTTVPKDMQVVQGFNDTVLGMQVGGKRTVIIPGKLAYGKNGSSTIPPNSSLVFTIELMSVTDTKQ